MQLGIFAKTYVRENVEAVFEAVQADGFSCVQFNMSCCGPEPMPRAIDGALVRRVHEAAVHHGVTISALSGTFNMIHPDKRQRTEGLTRLAVLAAAAGDLGTSVITLCTGSRDPANMWRYHPGNATPAAWNDLRASMDEALSIAADHDVTLAVEPEVSNTIDSALKARRLLDECGSSRLKIIMDPANLFHAGELSRMHDILEHAFELLGNDVVVAHAKDLSSDGRAGREAAGTGLLDYDTYISLLRRSRFQGPLILHGLNESQVPASRDYLQHKLAI